MPNKDNLVPFTRENAKRMGSKGGKRAAENRRRRADFRKMLDILLTTEINNPDITPFLESIGVDSTLEAAVNAAMIKEAMLGNVKAYEAIARFAGQSDKTEADEDEQKVRTDRAKRARDLEVAGEDITDEGIQSFLNAIRPGDDELKDLFEEDDDATSAEETDDI